jgi:hypothetical protein
VGDGGLGGMVGSFKDGGFCHPWWVQFIMVHFQIKRYLYMTTSTNIEYAVEGESSDKKNTAKLNTTHSRKVGSVRIGGM